MFPTPTPDGHSTIPGVRKLEWGTVEIFKGLVAGGYYPNRDTVNKAIDAAALLFNEMQSRFGTFESPEDYQQQLEELVEEEDV